MINSAHLENHLADGQRFSVLGVNVFAHLRVRDPISSYWHHPVPGVINSAHLESHLADGQRFSVLGVNIFAHLGVRDPIAARPAGITLSQV